MADYFDREPLGAWDDEIASTLPGRLVLVGLTIVTRDGDVVGQEQFHGAVVALERGVGITLELEGERAGEEYVLPPDMRALQRAKRGEYRLKTTGEVVVDPDYLATWTLTQAPDA